MGIARKVVIASAASMLLCIGMTGTAVAESSQSGKTADATSPDPVVNEDADINDPADYIEGVETPVSEKSPTRCDGPQTWISITSKSAYHVPAWWNGTKYKDGPGGTMSVSVTKSGTISAEMTVGSEAEMNAVIAKAKVSVSGKIGASVGITTGHTYSHDIGKKKYGHLQYGSWGYKVSWKKYRAQGNGCGAGTVIASGKATLPTKEVGWKYWETSS
ncbi:hypothetical protein [Streptomyces corynorhini]|uniref:hypothetical protein n=1 Tax=Streptomyces corynorhini TaxID=2282652 RepID=UPI001F3DA9EA|nr:hypothetical protein [Streptomyces corynorhini]